MSEQTTDPEPNSLQHLQNKVQQNLWNHLGLEDDAGANVWLAHLTAGVDEVGIGPLAGPVVAAAVILRRERPLGGLKDSKITTLKQRVQLAQDIREHALSWAIGEACVAEIDRLNVLRASHLAMQRAVAALALEPQLVLVDGNKTPSLPMPTVAVVKGDGRVPQISAASILAKVHRDQMMIALDAQLPGYGFAQHKGYPTRAHLSALEKLGPSAEHRRSFAPVRDAQQTATAQGSLLQVLEPTL